MRIVEAAEARPLRCVLDLGCGYGPYRLYFEGLAERYVGMDMDLEARPAVVGRGEALPFADGSFDAVLASQVLPVVDDPEQVGREIGRVLRAGGRAWVSCHGHWPYSTRRPEHRFGAPDLPRLFPGLKVREIVPEGGMMGFPFALFNIFIREVVRAAERRVGILSWALAVPVKILTVLSNLGGRFVETLAGWGPCRSFLGYLHNNLPMNFLVVVERPD
jgi:SAM-dependent methyltransferase